LSRINPEWEKAHRELAKKERARRAQRGSNWWKLLKLF
jgi:hypothetical protein